MKSWTEQSAEWLEAQAKAHPELSKEELRKWCSKHYPWQERSGWAYKAWLKAMRAYFKPETVRPKRGGKIQPTANELEQLGQQRLIT